MMSRRETDVSGQVALSAVSSPRYPSCILSPEAAKSRLAFGISMDRLMRMQNSFDIAQVRECEAEIKVAPLKGQTGDARAASAL